MTPTPYTEDTLVQQTSADFLEQELGWRSVYAFNNEDYGPESLLGRASDREVVLVRTLRAKLVELNPGLPDVAYDEAVRQITTISASQSLLATNRDKYNLLRDGVQVGFRNAKGELERRRLRLFDFSDPLNNDFLCVRELWVRGDLYRKRADIVGFVNGLPLLFMECKNVYKDLQTAYERNYKDYLDTIPHLFHHNALIVLGNGIEAKLGSLGSPYKFFHEWKRLDEDEPGVVDMATLLKGVCHKANFMDLVENFILFDESAGQARKILARNHQFLGVNRAVAAVRDREARSGKLGVFWHTQGAGKSYSMIFFTRKVHRKLGGNFTFLVLTDREDLDTQIYKTFAGCGVVDSDRDPCRASSGDDLRQLLGRHKSHIFSLIQKFMSLGATPGLRPPSPRGSGLGGAASMEDLNPSEESLYSSTSPEKELPSPIGRGAGGEGFEAALSLRNDLIVITDEAHRTQYGTLALNMRNALPNAGYIGFTGTPLFSDDEITRRVFGDYVSTYDFQRAVEDQATVPLYYDARGDKLGVAVNDLNDRIAAKLEELEIDDIDVQQRLEQELKRDYHIITHGKRLNQVAQDFVSHYSSAWESGKAMFVCIDKPTCVRMHKLIGFYWDQRIRELEKELATAVDEQDEQYRLRQIEWMRQTRMAVVISEEQGEVERFRKWDLDIIPHRRLIKEGMELPESLRDQPRFRNMQRLALDEAFKEPEHPFRIAIVCAMWLTGFDVPCLSTLYLDKPLKAHTLMQAIARANRVHEGKNNGLIVDYCGILKSLRKALATFAGKSDGGDDTGGETDPARPGAELLADLAEAIAFVRSFLADRGASLDDILTKTGFDRNAAILAAKEAVNENDETRKRFEVTCRAVFVKFKACINEKGVNAHRADRDAINVIYKSLQQDREEADITDIIRKLYEVVDKAIKVRPTPATENTEPYDISKIDFDRLRKEFERIRAKRTTVQNLKAVIELRLHRLLQQNPRRTDFQKRYEEIVADYNREKDRVTIEKTFEELMRIIRDIDDEGSRAVREGLDEESLALFDLLRKPELSAQDIKRVKAVAVDLLRTVKGRISEIKDWETKEATRNMILLTIRDFLWSDETGLPVELYSEDDVHARAEDVYRHVHRVYPTLPSPYYEARAA